MMNGECELTKMSNKKTNASNLTDLRRRQQFAERERVLDDAPIEWILPLVATRQRQVVVAVSIDALVHGHIVLAGERKEICQKVRFTVMLLLAAREKGKTE
jgi:hypothetical protein